VDLWNHNSLGGKKEGFTELDVTVGASKTIGDFRVAFEHASILFPDKSDNISDTHQIRSRVDWENTLLPIYLLAKYDYDQLNFLYLEGGIRKPITLTEQLSITPSLSISGTPLPGRLFEEKGFTSIQGGISAEWQPTMKGPSIYGSLQYLDSFDNDNYDGVTLGIGMRWSF